MKVKFKSIVAGPDCSYQPGQVAEVYEKFGSDLVKGNFAELVSGSVKQEPKSKESDTNKEYKDMHLEELRALCIDREIEYGDRLKEPGLIKLLEEADANPGDDNKTNYSELDQDKLETLCIERDIEFPEGADEPALIDLLEKADSEQDK